MGNTAGEVFVRILQELVVVPFVVELKQELVELVRELVVVLLVKVVFELGIVFLRQLVELRKLVFQILVELHIL